jgi:hypothetical protein
MYQESAIVRIIENAPKIFIIGYSPTGGGHTNRTFNILREALRLGKLPTNSLVIFHCPPIWNGQTNTAINEIVKELKQKNINVALALVDKTVYGYLKSDGRSDGGEIVRRFANYPTRECCSNDINNVYIVTNEPSITDIIYGDNVQLIKSFTMSAKSLIASLATVVPTTQESLENCYVITDMDPYLQKAAIAFGIPPKNCVDQQNHAILLNENNDDFKPHMALLAKVLCGYGGKVSHMGLGNKNTLSDLINTCQKLKIDEKTSIESVRRSLVELLLNTGNKVTCTTSGINIPEATAKAGCVLCKENLRAEDVSDLFYIYVHNYTMDVVQVISKQIALNNLAFTNKIFIVCGLKTLPNYNAMHIAYIYGANGITTGGAGTLGEWAYLHHQFWTNSRFLMLPIQGHNEQIANAQKMSQQYPNHAFIYNHNSKEDSIVSFVGTNSPAITNGGNMTGFFQAISSSDTYQAQATEVLFNGYSASSSQSSKYASIEQQMRQNTFLKMNRHYIKLVFQSLNYIQSHITTYGHINTGNFKMEIRFTQKAKPIVFNSFAEFYTAVNTSIYTLINPSICDFGTPPEEFILLSEFRTLLTRLSNRITILEATNAINAFEAQLGESMTTGF